MNESLRAARSLLIEWANELLVSNSTTTEASSTIIARLAIRALPARRSASPESASLAACAPTTPWKYLKQEPVQKLADFQLLAPALIDAQKPENVLLVVNHASPLSLKIGVTTLAAAGSGSKYLLSAPHSR